MAETNLTCTVLTPERTVLDAKVSGAVIPSHDGEVGILLNRAPLLCRLGVGILKIDGCEEAKQLFVNAGFAEVANNKITILTEQALMPEEVDAEKVQAAQEEARNRSATTTEEQDKRNTDLARCAAKLKLIGR